MKKGMFGVCVAARAAAAVSFSASRALGGVA
jgi:hypothetical protein